MGRILQAIKKEHYQDYSPEETVRAESALLTAWAVLRDLTDDLVLIGGLVPRYICKKTDDLHAVTIDVDLGVSLGLSSGQYDTTRKRLEDSGFEWKEKRFVKTIGKTPLYLDFLTDKPNSDSPDSAMVDDVPASAVFGVERALEVHRTVTITGKDLYGADVSEDVKVCDIGPYLCLKLQAYHNRAQSKDVFDTVRAVRDYDGGIDAAVTAFHKEANDNRAYDIALHTLKDRFASETSKGPVQYVDFCAGKLSASKSDETYMRQQYANEAVDVAIALLR
jgi:hypothetical protein